LQHLQDKNLQERAVLALSPWKESPFVLRLVTAKALDWDGYTHPVAESLS
jgi:hypothetical protein